MKLVSWNVAGFRACLKKGFEDFFKEANADVYCLQEVKALKEQIDFDPEGYYCYLNPAERKGYSGTLVYTKKEPINVTYGIGIEEHDHEGRVITVEFEDYFLVNEYVPNVKRDLSRLDYRMKWEDDFKNYLKGLEKKKPVVVCGDFNVAHTEMDIKNAKSNRGNAGFTDEEREGFTKLLARGFTDTFRFIHGDVKDIYSWWGQRIKTSKINNSGWRIDYFCVSDCLKDKLKDAKIHTQIFGSDHCPVELDIDL